MKDQYKGDLFPAETPEGASGKRFLDFFQIDKETDEPKGIISMEKGKGLSFFSEIFPGLEVLKKTIAL